MVISWLSDLALLNSLPFHLYGAMTIKTENH